MADKFVVVSGLTEEAGLKVYGPFNTSLAVSPSRGGNGTRNENYFASKRPSCNGFCSPVYVTDCVTKLRELLLQLFEIVPDICVHFFPPG